MRKFYLVGISTTCLLLAGCAHDRLLGKADIDGAEVSARTTDPWVPQRRSEIDPEWMNAVLAGARDSKTDAMVILHRGQPVFTWPPPSEQEPILLMSVTKLVVGLAVGILVEQGKLKVSDTAATYFPQWADDPRGAITVAQIMHHTSGLESPTPTHPIYKSGDFLSFALASKLIEQPGHTFRYNNNALNLLVGIIETAGGEPIEALVGREIFSPMSIRDWSWEQDSAGRAHGMAGLALKAIDMAKLGVLFNTRGTWLGVQIIPSSWFDYMLTPSPRTSELGALAWRLNVADAYVFDSAVAEHWASIGVSDALINAFSSLQGRSFATSQEYFAAFRSVLTASPELHAEFFDKVEGQGAALYSATNERLGLIYHTGNVGQYLITLPEHDIVVVRQLVETDEIVTATFERQDATYTFRELFPLCLKLASTPADSMK